MTGPERLVAQLAGRWACIHATRRMTEDESHPRTCTRNRSFVLGMRTSVLRTERLACRGSPTVPARTCAASGMARSFAPPRRLRNLGAFSEPSEFQARIRGLRRADPAWRKSHIEGLLRDIDEPWHSAC